MFITKDKFYSWRTTGQVVAGRKVRYYGCDYNGVWWCDCFGITEPSIAASGGPLGHRKDDRWPWVKHCNGKPSWREYAIVNFYYLLINKFKHKGVQYMDDINNKPVNDTPVPEMNKENMEEVFGEEVFETVHQPDDVTE